MSDDPQKVISTIAKIRAAGGTDGDVNDYLASIGATDVPSDPNTARHADYKSGNLAKRMLRANKADQDNIAEGEPGYLDRLGTMAERAASVLPGGRLALTATRNLTKRAIGEPESWAESSAANAEGVERGGQEAPGVNIPVLGRVTLADAPAAAVGFRALMRAAPGLTVPQAGAAYAGASRALNPEDESSVSRGIGTAGHAIVGAAIPKVIGGAVRGGRMLGAQIRANAAPSIDRNIVQREATMQAVGGPLYQVFEKLGDLPLTKSLRAVIDEPLVQEAMGRARKADAALSSLADNNAVMLQRAYREVGNKALNAQNGIDPTPTRMRLADALDEAAQLRGESYKVPLQIWRQAEGEIDALQNAEAVTRNAGTGRTPPTKVREESPAAFEQKYTGEIPNGGERTAAAEGILGRVKQNPPIQFRWGALGHETGHIWPRINPELKAAPDLPNFAEGGKQSAVGQIANTLSGVRPTPLGPSAASVGGPRNTPFQGTRLLGPGATQMPSGTPLQLPASTTPTIDELLRPKGYLGTGSLPVPESPLTGPAIPTTSGIPRRPLALPPGENPSYPLLAERARWANRGPIGTSTITFPEELQGGQTGPGVPTRGSLSEEEIFKLLRQLAMGIDRTPPVR